MTLGEWLDILLEAHDGRRRRSTLMGLENKVETVIKPRIGHVELQELITGARLAS